MDLAQFKAQIDSGKYGLVREFPEVGAEELFGEVMDVIVGRSRLAVIIGNDEESGPGPFRVRTLRVSEVISLGPDKVTVVEDVGWPVTAWQFVRRKPGEDAVWNTRLAYYDDYEDAAESLATQKLSEMPAHRESELQRFDYVQWSVIVGGEVMPAGVLLRHPDGVLRVEEFHGHEDDADYWSSRYEFVPENFLDDINHSSGRDEVFSETKVVLANSFADALDRAKYAFAKEHYEQTGRSLF